VNAAPAGFPQTILNAKEGSEFVWRSLLKAVHPVDQYSELACAHPAIPPGDVHGVAEGLPEVAEFLIRIDRGLVSDAQGDFHHLGRAVGREKRLHGIGVELGEPLWILGGRECGITPLKAIKVTAVV